jgi:hypothetical protein
MAALRGPSRNIAPTFVGCHGSSLGLRCVTCWLSCIPMPRWSRQNDDLIAQERDDDAGHPLAAFADLRACIGSCAALWADRRDGAQVDEAQQHSGPVGHPTHLADDPDAGSRGRGWRIVPHFAAAARRPSCCGREILNQDVSPSGLDRFL